MSKVISPQRLAIVRRVGMIFLCFVAAFLGAWVAVRSGLITSNAADQAIAENRQTVVSQEGEVIAEIADKVSPSVVSITTTQTGVDSIFGRSMQSQGAGTGIIVSDDGYILTNKHVIPEGVESVQVVTADGKTYDNVKVIGRDPTNDVAFAKIEGAKDLPALKLGDSDKVRIGQKVIAIGNVLGQFQNSVTQGIISGMGRPIETGGDGAAAETLSNLLQTDAAINPGNSGGPLLNLSGEVIGINTAIAQEAEGIGFAIPINDAKGLLDGVLTQGRVVKPFLGVQYIILNPSVAQQLNTKLTKGALIYAAQDSPIVSGSPAEKAGLQRGDIITKIDGQEVNERASLAARLNRHKPGDTVDLTVYRDGKEQGIRVTLEEYR